MLTGRRANDTEKDHARESSSLLMHIRDRDPTIDEGSEYASFSVSLHPIVLVIMVVMVLSGIFINTGSVHPAAMDFLSKMDTNKLIMEKPIANLFEKEPSNTAAKTMYEASKNTGIELVHGKTKSGCSFLTWTGKFGGNIKPTGPLSGKRIGIILADQFNDYQVYYLASFIGEYGGIMEFLMVDSGSSDTRVCGMWGIPVDPMPVLSDGNKAQKYRRLSDATAKDYDAVIIVGGHSPDNFVSQKDAIQFIQNAAAGGAVLGSIAEGALPLVRAGVIKGEKTTGNQLVEYLLREIADFQPNTSVVVDDDGPQTLITTQNTVDTPAFLQALCRLYNPMFQDVWKDSLKDKRVVIVAGEVYEDIELVVPVMELLHRGAKITVGTYNAPFSAKPPHFSSEFIVGNYGTTVPFEEIPSDQYSIRPVHEISLEEFEIVLLPGGFNPQHMLYSDSTMKWLGTAHKVGKPIAAICHGPIALAAGHMVEGKKITGVDGVETPVSVMGGHFRHKDIAIIDGTIITGRAPPELPEWLDAIFISLLSDMSS